MKTKDHSFSTRIRNEIFGWANTNLFFKIFNQPSAEVFESQTICRTDHIWLSLNWRVLFLRMKWKVCRLVSNLAFSRRNLSKVEKLIFRTNTIFLHFHSVVCFRRDRKIDTEEMSMNDISMNDIYRILVTWFHSSLSLKKKVFKFFISYWWSLRSIFVALDAHFCTWVPIFLLNSTNLQESCASRLIKIFLRFYTDSLESYL